MRDKALPLYAFAHFCVDISCALLLFGGAISGMEPISAFLLYNFFAFAVQLPLGLLADRWGRTQTFAALGCLLAAVAWLFTGIPAALVAGMGNALFHVGGGLHTLNSSKGCGKLGIFVSPGALGIYLGALPAVQQVLPALPVAVVLVLLAGGLLRLGTGAPNAPFTPVPVGGGRALLPLAALVLVVIIRSLMGGLFQFPWKGALGLWFALAVAGGKAAGGLLADRFGVRRVATLSLFVAAVGFAFSGHPLPGLLAVFAFNMTMPLTLWGAAWLLRGAKGMAFGLLTFGLFLGTLPVLLGIPLAAGESQLYVWGAIGSLLILNVGLREGEGVT